MTKSQHTILFVDDEPWFNAPLRETLQARGFNCASCTDVASALQFLAKNEVSVLVTDIMMPAGAGGPAVDSAEAGFAFVAEVHGKWPHLSIICLSVIGDQKKIRALKKEGVLYLRKGETPLQTAVSLIASKATKTYSY
jgi:CheY-like chemotaxis protein